MKVPLSWLKEFVQIKETPEKLAERLTLAGIEVEKIHRPGEGLDGVVVGQILKIEKHPSADKLQVVQVTVGKEQVLTIVCGAHNIAVGQKVPTALVGTTLPNGMTLERRSIRGVASEGMLCAEDELGLGKDHSGIVILDASAKVGQPFARAAGLDDTVFELAITPQRADLFSVYGIAREVSALAGVKLKAVRPVVSKLRNGNSANVKVQIIAKKLCAQYVAARIEHISQVDTPPWIRARLLASGMRPINVIVDISNYVMLELGQPLHAFDASRLAGSTTTTMIVRQARSGERLTTLDGKDRVLDPSMLVIADTRRAAAIAGVMGGETTEVSPTTTSIILESAIFDPVSIRRTSQRLGLRSEASSRFEKGIPSYLPQEACARAVELFSKITGARLVSLAASGTVQTRHPEVTFSVAWVNEFLGASLSVSQITAYLKRIGCAVRSTRGSLSVRPPSWRMDLNIPEEFVEEIGRLHGYNTLRPTHFSREASPTHIAPTVVWADQVKDILARCGYHETLSYSFYGARHVAPLGLPEADHYVVTNPLSPEQQHMRVTLIPGLLDAISKNVAHYDHVNLFEVGGVFLPTSRGLPNERQRVAMVSAGKESRLAHLQGAVRAFLTALGIDEQRIAIAPARRHGAVASGNIMIDDERVGYLFEADQQLLHAYKIRVEAACAEFSLERLMKQKMHKKAFKAFSRYPTVRRDLSVVVDPAVTFKDIRKLISGVDRLVVDIEGFDLFPYQGKKSIGLRITFQSDHRTLTSDEIQDVLDRVVARLQKDAGADIRSATNA